MRTASTCLVVGELGHALGLGHASWSDCCGSACTVDEYGGELSSKLAMYDRSTGRWREWLMPGAGMGDRTGHPYAVLSGCRDFRFSVWRAEFCANTFSGSTTNQGASGRAPDTHVDALVRQIFAVEGVIWALGRYAEAVAFDAGG